MYFSDYMWKYRPEDMESNIKNTFYPELGVKYFSIATLHRYLGHCDPSVLPDELRARVKEYSILAFGKYKNTFAPTVDKEYIPIQLILSYIKDGTIKWEDLPDEFIEDLKDDGPKWMKIEEKTKQEVKTQLQKIGRWQEHKVQVNAQS